MAGARDQAARVVRQESGTAEGEAARLSQGRAADELRLRAARALEAVHDWQAAGEILDSIEGDDPELQAEDTVTQDKRPATRQPVADRAVQERTGQQAQATG